jgi:hypothetical protein
VLEEKLSLGLSVGVTSSCELPRAEPETTREPRVQDNVSCTVTLQTVKHSPNTELPAGQPPSEKAWEVKGCDILRKADVPSILPQLREVTHLELLSYACTA